ncbi:TetR/AcrR family transcriptional regulator [Kineococcus terrestris]|uniref:TetR/AcrR family transcriptional regulator n=1 Tax=Kineococcus terrestris TaxID=2044856 RepID=UPI0034DAF06B
MTSRGDGYAKGRARRELILDEAVRLFGEVGYRGASLRELAQRCGLSHPGLLHHVGDKQSLLLAVLARRDELAAAGVGAGDRLDALVEVVRRNADQRAVVELVTVLSAEATAPDHPAHAFFAARYRRTVDELAAAFADAGHPGPRPAARRLVALLDGLQVQWLLEPGDVDMAAEVRRHLDTELAAARAARSDGRGHGDGGQG